MAILNLFDDVDRRVGLALTRASRAFCLHGTVLSSRRSLGLGLEYVCGQLLLGLGGLGFWGVVLYFVVLN